MKVWHPTKKKWKCSVSWWEHGSQAKAEVWLPHKKHQPAFTQEILRQIGVLCSLHKTVLCFKNNYFVTVQYAYSLHTFVSKEGRATDFAPRSQGSRQIFFLT